jgi:hypothetical protein
MFNVNNLNSALSLLKYPPFKNFPHISLKSSVPQRNPLKGGSLHLQPVLTFSKSNEQQLIRAT